MTNQIIDINHDYMSIICEYVIKTETQKNKKNIKNIIRDEFIKYKKSDSYKNGIILIDKWSSLYTRYDMEEDTINELFNNIGHLNIIKLLPKIAKHYGNDSCEDFMENCNNDDYTLKFHLVDYIIDEIIIADLK